MEVLAWNFAIFVAFKQLRKLVNYRFRSPYYIVDRLFGAAELRLGGDKGDVVRVERTDGVVGAVGRN